MIQALTSKLRWPFLNELLEKEEIAYVDYALAELLLASYEENEDAAAFVCYLSSAARNGHLCVCLDNEMADPDPYALLAANASAAISAETAEKFRRMVLNGLKALPVDLCEIVDPLAENDYPVRPICQFGKRVYLQRFWVYETQFLKTFRRLLEAPLSLQIDSEALYEKVGQMVFQNRLMPEQAAAILRASQQALTLICGGPGTGKTYTAGQLITVFLESMDPAQKQRCQIAIAAPTGKAAANLKKSLLSAAGPTALPHDLVSGTLHSLLEIGRSGTRKHDAPGKLSADIILVDECSMIDVRLMCALLQAVKPGASLILLGDRHQLPPVEAGSIFADMIAFLENGDANRRPSELKVCLRAELKGIVDFARLVNAGDAEKAWEALDSPSEIEGVRSLKLNAKPDNIRSIQRALLEYAHPYFPPPGQHEAELTSLLSQFNRFRILSPLRKGPLGVDALNLLFLRQAMRRVKPRQAFAVPIMLNSSFPKMELFNGEVGILVKRQAAPNASDLHCEEGDYALFPKKGEDGKEEWRKFPALTLPSFEYAYCLSVYKSQGSEFDHVLLLMPQGSECFGREVLYTAVTRARKQLDIWEQTGVIKETIQRQARRCSGIVDILQQN